MATKTVVRTLPQSEPRETVRGEALIITAAGHDREELGGELALAGFEARARGPGRATIDEIARRPTVLAVVVLEEGGECVLDFVAEAKRCLGAFAPPTIVIALTESDDALERAFELGALDVLVAPVAPALLRVKAIRYARRPSFGALRAVKGYELLGILGRGGMGTVYRARRADGVSVALKVLELDAFTEAEQVVRFRRESEVLRTIVGDHIPRFLDAGRSEDSFFLAMEHVPGESLSSRLERGPLGERETARAIDDVAEALQAIHAAGLVHRDVKPSNVILRPDGSAVLVDFGLAKHVGDNGLTRDCEVMGTPPYLSPELVRGEHATAASDGYALGVTALEAMLGKCPLDGTDTQITMQIANDLVPSAAELLPAADSIFVSVIDGLLDPDPRARTPLSVAREAVREMSRLRSASIADGERVVLRATA